MTPDLVPVLQRAIDRRAGLLARLQAEGTDCCRLLHGIAEDAPGLTVDRYGSLLLVQTFREPLAARDVDTVQATVNAALGLELAVVCNHRGKGPESTDAHRPDQAALAERECSEAAVRFAICARHRGQDPWLFLDLRAGRRAVRGVARDGSVLNLFAYTCGVGVVAAVAGASHVLNVDFAQSALDVGMQNAAKNGIDPERFAVLRSDCLPVLRQLAGQPVQRRDRRAGFPRVERQRFDLIVLDPPRFAKTPFGTIDVVADYQSLMKPSLLALADGGAVLATNHVPEVAAADWHALLRRCAEKAGRPLRSLEPIPVDDDFPSFDGRPPLKVVLARL